MHRLILAAAGVGFGTLAALATAARADSWWDVGHARMNALAGGPTNAYDAELLGRYGCYSGTRSAFCQAHGRYRYYRHRRRAYR